MVKECQNYSWNMCLNQDISIVTIILTFIMEQKSSVWFYYGKEISQIDIIYITVYFNFFLLWWNRHNKIDHLIFFKCIVQ